MDKLCQYCNQSISFDVGRDFSRHCANCKSRPGYWEGVQKQTQLRLSKRQIICINCLKCKNKFTQSVTSHQLKFLDYKKYCSYKCSNSREQTTEIRKRKSEKLKGQNNPNYNPTKFENRPCVICKKEFMVLHWLKTQTCKQKVCLRRLNSLRQKERKFGGHTSKKAIYYKTKEGDTVYLQSNYEVKVA